MLTSRNYPPSPSLNPYVKQHYVFAADLPADYEMLDWVMSETAFVRILIAGDWAAKTESGKWTTAGPVVFFGPNSKPLPVRVRGPFVVAGVAIRPSGWGALFNQPASNLVNQMLPLSDLWGDLADTLFRRCSGERSDEQIVQAIEDIFTRQLGIIGKYISDEKMIKFDYIARTDSTRMVKDIADDIGISLRQMERRCYACFGQTPKWVLRRSRFLDMAAAMREFSQPSAHELAALRYFDDSHLNREFKQFANMTPKAFKATPTPLMTAGLKFRAEAHDLEHPSDA